MKILQCAALDMSRADIGSQCIAAAAAPISTATLHSPDIASRQNRLQHDVGSDIQLVAVDY